MNCKEIQNKLLFYIENETNTTENEQIGSHLKHCTHCQRLHLNITNELKTLALTTEIKAKPFMFTRIEAKLENRIHQPSTSLSTKWVLQPLLVAAGLVVGIYIGMMVALTLIPQQSKTADNKQDEIEMYASEIYVNELEHETIENYLLTE